MANIINRNLIYNNVTNIIITGNEVSVKVVNNTIGKSTTGPGILWEGQRVVICIIILCCPMPNMV